MEIKTGFLEGETWVFKYDLHDAVYYFDFREYTACNAESSLSFWHILQLSSSGLVSYVLLVEERGNWKILEDQMVVKRGDKMVYILRVWDISWWKVFTILVILRRCD